MLSAAASGVLYGVAGPGIGLWPLAFVCWTPLLVALRQRSPRHAAALGLVQGMAASLVATPWILSAAQRLTGWGWGASLVVATLIWLEQSGRMAALGWLAARATRRGWPLGLGFGVALAGVEVAYPMLFGWQSAIHVHDVPLLLQAADLGGPILVSVALAGGSVALAELLIARSEGRRPHHPGIALALLGPALLVAYGLVRLPMVARQIASAPKARIGVVQANLGLRGVRAAQSWKRHIEPTKALAERERLDLVVWPETALHATYSANDLSDALPRALYGDDRARPLPPILTGVNVAGSEAGGTGGPATNSAALVDRALGTVGRYDKNRLVPFGEYVPFGDVWPILYDWFPRSGPVARGNGAPALLLGQHPISALICYEDTLPSYASAVVREGRPELLVNLTNDGWFGRTQAATMHFALAKLRAIEHRRYLVRAANTGVSAIVDPVGRVTQQAPQFTAATLVGDIAWMNDGTVYEAIGDAPWWLCAVLALGMGFVPVAMRRAPEASISA